MNCAPAEHRGCLQSHGGRTQERGERDSHVMRYEGRRSMNHKITGMCGISLFLDVRLIFFLELLQQLMSSYGCTAAVVMVLPISQWNCHEKF